VTGLGATVGDVVGCEVRSRTAGHGAHNAELGEE
jgi:hypothetical protein